MIDKIIVAIDSQDEIVVNELLTQLQGKVSWVKIGMEAFNSFGPNVVLKAKELGFSIFLDLKLHDIPNTVGRTIKSLSKLGANIINVHSLGGEDMMRAAKDNANDCKIIAVTHLTSSNDTILKQIGIEESIQSATLSLAKLAYKSELDGVVCSALDVNLIKKQISNDFICVTPGIRPLWSRAQDQKRVLTPRQALDAGSDYLVIGRPITEGKSPIKNLQRILDE